MLCPTKSPSQTPAISPEHALTARSSWSWQWEQCRPAEHGPLPGHGAEEGQIRATVQAGCAGDDGGGQLQETWNQGDPGESAGVSSKTSQLQVLSEGKGPEVAGGAVTDLSDGEGAAVSSKDRSLEHPYIVMV